jgi:NADH-quinone oxidoreductase subunit L
MPFFAGFFSKDEILWKTWSASTFSLPAGANKILWAVGAVTALLTAVYMTRMMVMTFWGSERFRESHADEHGTHGGDHHGVHEPHESPWIMTAPLVILAVLSTVGGFIGVPFALSRFVTDHDVNVIEHTLEPVVASLPGEGHATEQKEAKLISTPPQGTDSASPLHPLSDASTTTTHATHSAEELNAEVMLAVVSVLIGLAGIFIGWFTFMKRPLLKLPRILEQKYYVDEIYDAALIHPIEAGSREGLWKIFDIGVIDGILHGLGDAVTETGKLARYLQAGFLRGYAAIILAGALIMIGIFTYFSFPR